MWQLACILETCSLSRGPGAVLRLGHLKIDLKTMVQRCHHLNTTQIGISIYGGKF